MERRGHLDESLQKRLFRYRGFQPDGLPVLVRFEELLIAITAQAFGKCACSPIERRSVCDFLLMSGARLHRQPGVFPKTRIRERELAKEKNRASIRGHRSRVHAAGANASIFGKIAQGT